MRPDGITTKNIKSAVMPVQHVFDNVTKNFNKLQNEISDSPVYMAVMFSTTFWWFHILPDDWEDPYASYYGRPIDGFPETKDSIQYSYDTPKRCLMSRDRLR